tara:strand:+ start:1312 stop:2217 length:906 start_codon:yes stop_codon:yes gene_type:complete
MPYQVTMDRSLSDEDLDRLQIANYNRRKFNTRFATESDSEFADENKKFLRGLETAHPTGRWRCIRWISIQDCYDEKVKFPLNSDTDPLGLEAHEDNNAPIVSASYCFPCVETREDGETWNYMPDGHIAMLEKLQQDWEQNGGAGDVRTTLGIAEGGLWADSPNGETSREYVSNWCLEDVGPFGIIMGDDGETIVEHSKISLVPMIRYFKSVGVTHHGYYVMGSVPKKFAYDYQMDTDSVNRQKINGQDRNQSPSDFCWDIAYNLNMEDDTTVCFVAQYLNQEDAVRFGPSDITDYGWPGTK